MKILIVMFARLVCVTAFLFFVSGCHRSGGAKEKHKFSDAEFRQFEEAKQKALERVLGPMHNVVGHAIIPFDIGGSVDMYYFTNGVPGTAFATMELIEPDGTGPKPNRIGAFELVAFTKLRMPTQQEPRDNADPFNVIERRMCGILTTVGRYAHDEVLNPGETCEVPAGDGKPTRCLILDEFRKNNEPFKINEKRYCLLLCMEIFRTEMEYAMKHGSASVLKRLKEKGYYPYSDLDREPVF